jgi:hypothetical protein
MQPLSCFGFHLSNLLLTKNFIHPTLLSSVPSLAIINHRSLKWHAEAPLENLRLKKLHSIRVTTIAPTPNTQQAKIVDRPVTRILDLPSRVVGACMLSQKMLKMFDFLRLRNFISCILGAVSIKKSVMINSDTVTIIS